MRYKNIILDVGGVLLSYRWLGVVMETLPDETKARAFAGRLFDDPLWQEFDIELRSFDDVLEDYVKKYPEDEEHIRYVLGHLERMPLPRKKVWDKLHELKTAGYGIYLLSNYSSRMFHVHTDGLPFLKDIDGHIISFETHHLKPHREIYEDLFERYSLDPAECIFFDDRQDNVDGGRVCGMEGRVIYSEEVLLGYMDRLLAPDGISNKFHDESIFPDERIDWLLSEMTMEEKIILYSHPEQGAGRLGVEGFILGGEASHGVEARNDQNGIQSADTTTSFPNPIGMSSSWDTEMIREAGRITGTEARASFVRHRKTGLSRWAPTVDMVRDPRWGRNEEGYGEDPYLTAENASAYIKGLQGDDPHYIRCGATLKHYYANNTEFDRFSGNSSVGLRDKYEYYLPPFKKAIENAGALGVMAAYNKINGVPGMINPEIRSLLKDKYGLVHAVSDGFAMVRLRDFHHEYGTLAGCLSESLRAGVDSMSDRPEDVEKALRDAVELSLLSEKELDEALHNILMCGMKLGIYDKKTSSPYGEIQSGDIDTKEARDVCLKMSEESLVLLENNNDVLPLGRDDAECIALAGPLADEWLKDWYGGVPPFRHTVREGLETLLEREIPFVKGLDKYRILSGGKAWHIEDDGSVGLTDKKDGELFYVEDWGEGYYTIRSVSTGRYVQSVFYGAEEEERGYLTADKEDVFDWFTVCRFHIIFTEDGTVEIRDRFAKAVTVTKEGRIKADNTLPPVKLELEKASDGMGEAVAACASADTVILVLGCNPLIPAREDFDRTSLALPSGQQRLLDGFSCTGKKVIVVLLSNYPYTFEGTEKKADALLLSATGSEYMGDAVARALFGEISPAGRLAQGWPVSEKVLPDMNDYRIIGKRTYRYVADNWLYPFGYGLSYGRISYSDMEVTVDDTAISISLDVENTGEHVTDEVIQIYAGAGFTDEKLTGAFYGRRLIAFKRIKGLRPGERRKAYISADISELQLYDVVTGGYFIYEGTYHIYAGRDALCEAAAVDIRINGRDFAERDLSHMTCVYACDDYENSEFVQGCFGMTAAENDGAVLTFMKSRLPRDAEKMALLLYSEESGGVDIIWNGKTIAMWRGNTSSPERKMTAYELPSEYAAVPWRWPAYWTEAICVFDSSCREETGTLKLKLKGDVRLLSLKSL